MANEYYKSDTLKLYCFVGCIAILLSIFAQYTFVHDLQRNSNVETRPAQDTPIAGGLLIFTILVTTLASFVFISLMFLNKGNVVFATALLLILIASLVISLLRIMAGIGGVA
jgi:H+/Cl- antiporter ClcA